MDKYDYMILEVIQSHKERYGTYICLSDIEKNFWKRIQEDKSLSIGQARIGERVAQLYIKDLIQNKDGYMVTRKGREVLSFAPAKQMSAAS
jgi:Mn-dependent DtxR family transcriptional regulator